MKQTAGCYWILLFSVHASGAFRNQCMIKYMYFDASSDGPKRTAEFILSWFIISALGRIKRVR